MAAHLAAAGRHMAQKRTSLDVSYNDFLQLVSFYFGDFLFWFVNEYYELM
jgi:hypothetical protein